MIHTIKPTLLIALLVVSCIDPYNATVGDIQKFLVVDALVTNSKGPFTISLLYSAPNIYESSDYIETANVKITVKDGGEYQLTNIGNGKYVTPNNFIPVVGKWYKLFIENNSKKYESEWCRLPTPASIDSISYRAKTSVGNSSETLVLCFSVDASLNTNEETYLRWELIEDWKFKLSAPGDVKKNHAYSIQCLYRTQQSMIYSVNTTVKFPQIAGLYLAPMLLKIALL